MNHVMVDLETLGTRPGCVVLSIGAVRFDPLRDISGSPTFFYGVLSSKEQETRGLEIDAETKAWWGRQSEEAQAVLKISTSDNAQPVIETLTEFANFLLSADEAPRLWGNGSDFDNAILAELYHRFKLPVPWKFYHNRCYRTLKSFAPAVKLERQGTYHNALDDAMSQAEHALKILAHTGLPLA